MAPCPPGEANFFSVNEPRPDLANQDLKNFFRGKISEPRPDLANQDLNLFLSRLTYRPKT